MIYQSNNRGLYWAYNLGRGGIFPFRIKLYEPKIEYVWPPRGTTALKGFEISRHWQLNVRPVSHLPHHIFLDHIEKSYFRFLAMGIALALSHLPHGTFPRPHKFLACKKFWPLKALKDRKIQEEFKLELRTRFEALTDIPDDIDEQWDKLKEICNSVCKEKLGIKTPNRKGWISQTSWDKVQVMKEKKD